MTFMVTCYGYEIETELIVRWLEVELMSVNGGSLWSVLCEEGAWVVIDRNCADCKAMCGLFCQVEL